MFERFGHVLGWMGNLFSVLVLILTAVWMISTTFDRAAIAIGIVIGCVVALTIFGVGQALRYIFAGPSRGAS